MRQSQSRLAAISRYGLRVPILIQAGCALAGTLLAGLLAETAPPPLARRTAAAAGAPVR
jgi:hypothetical protein